MKAFLLLLLCWASLSGAAVAHEGKRFGAIWTDPGWPGHRNVILLDFDATYAWMGRHCGDARDHGGNTRPAVFVFSKSHNNWIEIREVSTAGAVLGKSIPNFRRQVEWNFTDLASKESVALPLIGNGVIHLPEKAVYDGTRQGYVLSFDSNSKIKSEETTLFIPEKDLKAAFDALAAPRQAR